MSNYSQTGYPPGHPTPVHPQDGYPPQRPRSGCGGCLGKFFIFLGVIFLLLIAVCCGGLFYIPTYFASSVSQQPAEVQAISDEIISIRVPPPLEPVGGGRFKVPLIGTSLGQGAIFSDKRRTSLLVLASFGDAFGEQFKNQLLKGLESGQTQRQPADNNEINEELKDTKTSKLEPTINGEKATFNITEGTGVQSGKRRIRVQGGFKGKTGPALFNLNTEAETLSIDKVEEMIDSIE